MTKILLALSILSVGAGGFLAARQVTAQFEREAGAAREAWMTQTQLVSVAHSQKAELTERVRDLRQALRQSPMVAENSLWSLLQSNPPVELSPELQERLLQELGFDWQFSPDFIVVTKQSLRSTGGWIFKDDHCSEVDAAVLALTPDERTQVQAAIQRVRTDFNDWVLTHIERFGATNEVIAKYLSPDPARLQTINTEFKTALLGALRQDRAQLIRFAIDWMRLIGAANYGYPTRMVLKWDLTADQPRLKAEIQKNYRPGVTKPASIAIQSGYPPALLFPDAFRCTFPNGWAEVARLEGFELPGESKE